MARYREYLSQLNIDVENEWTVMTSEYSTRLNLAIASGDIPDIIQLDNQTQLRTLVEAEMVADITDVYEEYASEDTKAFMSGDGGNALDICTYDGRLYALPNMNATVYNVSLLWIRQDWLDNLGLQAPETIEDVIEIARAFTYDDPDGNGADDTYGLALSDALFDGTTSLVGFFNGYHAYPDQWVTLEDGSVAYGAIQPEAKEALAAVAEMYQDCLLYTSSLKLFHSFEIFWIKRCNAGLSLSLRQAIRISSFSSSPESGRKTTFSVPMSHG